MVLVAAFPSYLEGGGDEPAVHVSQHAVLVLGVGLLHPLHRVRELHLNHHHHHQPQQHHPACWVRPVHKGGPHNGRRTSTRSPFVRPASAFGGPCFKKSAPLAVPASSYLLDVWREDVDLPLVERGDVDADDLVLVVAHGEVQVRVQVGVRPVERVAQQRRLALRLQQAHRSPDQRPLTCLPPVPAPSCVVVQVGGRWVRECGTLLLRLAGVHSCRGLSLGSQADRPLSGYLAAV